MQQVKIFKALENDTAKLETEMNRWLKDTGFRILHIFGNIAPQSAPKEAAQGSISSSPFVPSDVLIVVLYETP